jgi:hypothetical protein
LNFRIYKSRHPWGDEARQIAINTAALGNLLQAKGKRLKYTDFRYEYRVARQVDDQMIQRQMESFARAHNRKLSRRNNDEHRRGSSRGKVGT